MFWWVQETNVPIIVPGFFIFGFLWKHNYWWVWIQNVESNDFSKLVFPHYTDRLTPKAFEVVHQILQLSIPNYIPLHQYNPKKEQIFCHDFLIKKEISQYKLNYQDIL